MDFHDVTVEVSEGQHCFKGGIDTQRNTTRGMLAAREGCIATRARVKTLPDGSIVRAFSEAQHVAGGKLCHCEALDELGLVSGGWGIGSMNHGRSVYCEKMYYIFKFGTRSEIIILVLFQTLRINMC